MLAVALDRGTVKGFEQVRGGRGEGRGVESCSTVRTRFRDQERSPRKGHKTVTAPSHSRCCGGASTGPDPSTGLAPSWCRVSPYRFGHSASLQHTVGRGLFRHSDVWATWPKPGTCSFPTTSKQVAGSTSRFSMKNIVCSVAGVPLSWNQDCRMAQLLHGQHHSTQSRVVHQVVTGRCVFRLRFYLQFRGRLRPSDVRSQRTRIRTSVPRAIGQVHGSSPARFGASRPCPRVLSLVLPLTRNRMDEALLLYYTIYHPPPLHVSTCKPAMRALASAVDFQSLTLATT